MAKMKYITKLVLVILIITSCSKKSNSQNTGEVIIERKVSFVSDNVLLAGTIYLPENKKNLPALVLTHGAGREGRHLKTYQYQGEFFAKLGFATLVFDKRGVGESEGEYVEATDLNIPARDLISAVKKIKAQPEVDEGKIGVMGYSQGSWIGPLASTMSKDISFVINLVGGGVSVRDQVLHNRKSELIEKGWPQKKIEEAMVFCKKLYDYCATGCGYEKLKDEYINASKRDWFSFIEGQGFGKTLVPPQYLNHPFFKSLKYDPKEAEEMLNVPFLAIFGEEDAKVPTANAVEAMKSAFNNSGFKDYTILVIPEEGHNAFKMENGKVQFREAFKSPLVNWLNQIKNKMK